MLYFRYKWKYLLVAIFLLSFSFMQTSYAQDSEQTPETKEEIGTQLSEIKSSINLGEKTIKSLEKEIKKLNGNQSKQNAALIAAAQRIKLAEIELDVIEENLKSLLNDEKIIKNRLDGTNIEISNILGALQRIGRSPAPAMVVNAGEALNSARSAMLISAILPQFNKKAKIIKTDLEDLIKIVEKAQAEEDLFANRLEDLAKEKFRISQILKTRENEMKIINAKLQKQIETTQKLVGQANSLEELLKLLSNNATLTNDIAEQMAITNSDDAREISAAYANLSRKQPAILFSKARGYLKIPASGVIVRKFGANDNMGGKAKGISIITRANAQVVAPIDGWVIYQGNYLNYGEIIIIDAGEGYSVLLAGLNKTNVKTAQFIMRDEPIGEMGKRTNNKGVSTNAGISRPTLYIELREQNISIDPSLWWREQNRQTING